MALPKIFTAKKNQRQRGFTLIEMMVVIGIFTTLAGVTMFFDLGNYRGESFRGEARILATVLQTARADALNNINEKPHGIAIHPPGYDHSYIIFQGNSYFDPLRDTSSDQEIKESYNVNFDGSSPPEIVFSQLSGDANYDGLITLEDPERSGITAIISINHEGQINW